MDTERILWESVSAFVGGVESELVILVGDTPRRLAQGAVNMRKWSPFFRAMRYRGGMKMHENNARLVMTKTMTAWIWRGAKKGGIGARFFFFPDREHDCCCSGKPGVLFQRVLDEHGMAQVLAIAGSLWTCPPNKLFIKAVSFNC